MAVAIVDCNAPQHLQGIDQSRTRRAASHGHDCCRARPPEPSEAGSWPVSGPRCRAVSPRSGRVSTAMASDQLRDELRLLRIDRDAPPPQGGHRRTVAVVAGTVMVLAAGGLFAYRYAALAPRQVEVAYVRVTAGGAQLRAPVFSGAGYVITGEKYIAIGVRVPGRIVRYLVDEGDLVEVGQTLVALDDRDYRAQVGRAEAALRVAVTNRDLAHAQLQRVRGLFEQGVTSRDELDQKENRDAVAAATAAQAENELAQARLNLEDTLLRSPVKGVVLAKLKAVGEIAVPGGFAGAGDLLRIADLSEFRAEVDVNEIDLAKVHLGQEAEVVPDAFPARRYRSKVVKLHPQVNRQKGTLTVEVLIEERDDHLLPEMSARVTFLAAPAAGRAEGASSVVLPRQAVRSEGLTTFVWEVTAGRARRREVRTGDAFGDEIAVLHGLAGGEAIVVGSADGLIEGGEVATTVPRGPQ